MTGTAHVPVSSVMSAPVHAISPLAPVTEAIEAMHEHRVSSLVVERRDGNDECGIVSVSDIADKVIATHRSPGRVNVYEIMSKPVVMVPESMDIRIAVQLLVRFNLSRAVVHDPQRNPVGVVSVRDAVIRYLRGVPGEPEAG